MRVTTERKKDSGEGKVEQAETQESFRSTVTGFQIVNETAVADDQMVLDVSFDGEVRQVKLREPAGYGSWRRRSPLSR